MKIFGKFIIFLIKGGLGIGAIYVTNLLLSSVNIAVGLNIVNGTVIGILGLSGFFLLYALALVDMFLF